MRLSLINIGRLLHKLYRELTELSSCGLRKSGRIILAEDTFAPRLRTYSVPAISRVLKRVNKIFVTTRLQTAARSAGLSHSSSPLPSTSFLFLPPRVVGDSNYLVDQPFAKMSDKLPDSNQHN
jgi:hypothetical protein